MGQGKSKGINWKATEIIWKEMMVVCSRLSTEEMDGGGEKGLGSVYTLR